MPVRNIIEIDEELCNGCGECVTACAEGAIQIIDGKARLISETYCDGLGACLGHCPTGALSVIERQSEEFDEEAVAQHLERQNEKVRHAPANLPIHGGMAAHSGGGCPGSRARSFVPAALPTEAANPQNIQSQLMHWPVQLHLVPPTAPFFRDADLLLSADCVAYTLGDFHRSHLRGRSLAIACPKLDTNQDIYLEKLITMIDEGGIRSLTVMIMEVPCCSGLLRLVQQALADAQRQIPVTCKVVSVSGKVIGEHRFDAGEMVA